VVSGQPGNGLDKTVDGLGVLHYTQGGFLRAFLTERGFPVHLSTRTLAFLGSIVVVLACGPARAGFVDAFAPPQWQIATTNSAGSAGVNSTQASIQDYLVQNLPGFQSGSVRLTRPNLPEAYTVSFDWTLSLHSSAPVFSFGLSVLNELGAIDYARPLAGGMTGTYSGSVSGLALDAGDSLALRISHDVTHGSFEHPNSAQATITNFTFTPVAAPSVPEPGTLLLSLIGAVGVFGAAWIRGRR
jgi:hypothetical protein